MSNHQLWSTESNVRLFIEIQAIDINWKQTRYAIALYNLNKLNITQNQTMQITAKQNCPAGSVTSYDTWPGNEMGDAEPTRGVLKIHSLGGHKYVA